jgi:outer membrane protein assembly factor BamD (BamD/ComL family)
MSDLRSLLAQVLLESDPAVAGLLVSGLDLLNAGHYTEARSAFQAIMEEHKDSGLQPVALWALALSHYREGGAENLAMSAGRFADFLARYGQFKPEILVEAAQVDLAVICVDLIKSDASERLKVEAATVAAASLQSFLDKWPGHPQAAAIRNSLLQVQSLLPGMQQSRNVRIPHPEG